MGSSLRTLVIASAASAAGALLVSELWIAGTWIAAAVTPVIVTVVSELLNRPTERIARRLTSTRGPPAAGGTAPQASPPSRRSKIAYGAVFGTAALAFVIAVAAVTVPELVAGGNDGPTTFFGGEKDNSAREPDPEKPQDEAPDDEAKPEDQQEEEQPTTPTREPPTTPDEEQPTTPTEETPAPGEPLPEQAPAPPAEPR